MSTFKDQIGAVAGGRADRVMYLMRTLAAWANEGKVKVALPEPELDAIVERMDRYERGDVTAVRQEDVDFLSALFDRVVAAYAWSDEHRERLVRELAGMGIKVDLENTP